MKFFEQKFIYLDKTHATTISSSDISSAKPSHDADLQPIVSSSVFQRFEPYPSSRYIDGKPYESSVHEDKISRKYALCILKKAEDDQNLA